MARELKYKPIVPPFMWDSTGAIRDDEGKPVAWMGWSRRIGCSMRVSNEERNALAERIVTLLNAWGAELDKKPKGSK